MVLNVFFSLSIGSIVRLGNSPVGAKEVASFGWEIKHTIALPPFLGKDQERTTCALSVIKTFVQEEGRGPWITAVQGMTAAVARACVEISVQ